MNDVLKGYTCSCCGKYHDELPFDYASNAPVYYEEASKKERKKRFELTDDLCVMDGEHFFIRGCIEIPVIGLDEPFVWGVWVSLSEKNFEITLENWDNPNGEEEVEPMFGWLSTDLPFYPNTINLKTYVHTRSGDLRPYIELEPTDHLLSIEQREGITIERVNEIAQKFCKQKYTGTKGAGSQMIKLIKKIDETVHYWEVWNDRKMLNIHYGIVGDEGESEEVKVPLFKSTEKEMARLADKKLEEGYELLDEEILPEIIVQHKNAGLTMEEALDKRHLVEELLDQSLGWTGNGMVDGGEIEVNEGITNVFCVVLNIEKAYTAIKKELAEHNLMDGVTIAYLESEDEDYTTLYPEGATIEM